MRRLLIGIVIVGIVLSAGVSSAQESGPGMPEKVRAFLDKMTGSWSRIDEGFKAEAELEWDSGKGALLDRGRFQEGDMTGSWSELWLWDGTSADGVISIWSGSTNRGFSHGTLRARVVSDTLLAGKKTEVTHGKEATSSVEIEFRGSGRVTWKETNGVVGGEKKPDIVETYTITKTTSKEQELIKLEDELAEAVAKKNIAAVDRLSADDLTLATSDGRLITKGQMIDHLQSDELKLTSLRCEDLKARLYGDMSVVTGVLRWASADGENGRDLITDVWQKRDGRWQMVATQESEIETTVDSDKLSPEMKKLEVFVGNRTYEGEQADPPVAGLPYGPAGKYSGTVTTRFVLHGRFLEEKIEDHNPSGITKVVAMTGYDAKAKNYVTHVYADDGSTETSVKTITPDGRTWTTHSTLTTSKGDKVSVRNVMEFSPDGASYTSTTEVSPDGGKTWKHWFSEKGRKANN